MRGSCPEGWVSLTALARGHRRLDTIDAVEPRVTQRRGRDVGLGKGPGGDRRLVAGHGGRVTARRGSTACETCAHLALTSSNCLPHAQACFVIASLVPTSTRILSAISRKVHKMQTGAWLLMGLLVGAV